MRMNPPLMTIFVLPWLFLMSSLALADELPVQDLQRDLAPILEIFSGKSTSSQFTASIQVPIKGSLQTIELRLLRGVRGEYELSATHSDYSFVLHRSQSRTVFALPHHQVAFVGVGPEPLQDHLAPDGIYARLLSSESDVFQMGQLLTAWNPLVAMQALFTFTKPTFNEELNEWKFNDVKVRFRETGSHCLISHPQGSAQITMTGKQGENELIWTSMAGFKMVQRPREELERQLVRGVRRATEILRPGPTLSHPLRNTRTVQNGELRWIEGQRVCILSGTPQEIGTAHGQLLKTEALKTIDSVLYTFGTVNTIRTGRWFRKDLEGAYQRLAPHIPEDHKIETESLAKELGIENQLAQTLNVFPELFHCSGFAVFGSATADGKLYHGRVLDYMTTIGLQDAATTFIVAVDGKIPFANVGYAGFIGSVTGMNVQAVSLGEMGGQGEGQWDGVPMATLMRRALEECSTLEEVMALWERSPRTCEYYYVFADGKTNRAVGVAATPDSLEFIKPGQSHERLGEGIADSVVLSAGSRLQKLRERVQEKHGKIDVETAIWLMSRPVAMESNLHNALLIPADGILYVANADHKHPAAERPYVRLDLKQLLKQATTEKTSESTVSQQD